MSKDNLPGPTICPFCGAHELHVWPSDSTQWRCKSCAAKFAVRAYPPHQDDQDDKRTDLIAKAHRGRLSCNEALLLAENLTAHARQTVEQLRTVRIAL